jgi:hypothetical protein
MKERDKREKTIFFSPRFLITTSNLEDRILETYFAGNTLANVEKLTKCFLIFLKPVHEQKRKSYLTSSSLCPAV